MIGGIETGGTPLERRLGEFGTRVALAILALGLIPTIAGVVIEGIGRLGQVFLLCGGPGRGPASSHQQAAPGVERPLSLEETRTTLFVYKSALQLVFAYPSRRMGTRATANLCVHLAVWLGVALQILTILIAPLRALLGLVPLGAGTLVAVMLAVLLTWARAELSCRWTIEA
jgi:hypothetical protein